MTCTKWLLMVLLFLFIPYIQATPGTKGLKIVNTTVDYQSSPLLVASPTPRFGWQVHMEEGHRGTRQSGYALELFSRENGNLHKVWETGKVTSSLSQRVAYEGSENLEAGKPYAWRVKVWDSDDVASSWSDLSFFRIAPSQLDDRAKWIGAIDKKDANLPPGRVYHGLTIGSEEGKKWQETHPLSKRSIYLRKDVTVKKEVTHAIIYISGLGHYELTMNGEKIGNAQFDPMWSDYDKTIYYNAYEVTDLLQTENALGVLLGNGFFNQQGGRYVKMQVSFGPPTLLFALAITYSDGSHETIYSDESWKYAPSPLVFNDMYGGEDYDARLEQEGWDRYGFNDVNWLPVVVQSAPQGELTPQTTDPITVNETYAPASVVKAGDAYVYDMGQNLSGFPRVKVQGKKGQVVRLTVAENVQEGGLVDQSQSGSPHYYEYTLKGGEEEVWQPRFSYYGYRYIQVDGAKPRGMDDERELPIIHEMTSCFVYNSSKRNGHFESSNPLFNDAYRIIINAIKSNMHAVFTDCPHREKLGWLEQVHLNGPGLFYNFDLTTFAPKIMQDIRDAQLPNGLVPDIAPEYVIFEGGFRDSPEWGSTSVFLPFQYYEYYGDDTLIMEFYDVMKRYADYLRSTATNHIVSHGLGDWCDYREDQPYGVSHNTPVPLSATMHYYLVVEHVAKAAAMKGLVEDEAYYEHLRKEIKTAFNKEFLHKETLQYGTGSQASNAMPLFAGIVEPRHKATVLKNLLNDIEEKGYRLSTGDVGNRYLFQTLAQHGLNEVMYTMHNHREVPGYGFQLQFGATTLTELWDPRAGASWNHFMMGQIVEWFFKSLGGITMVPRSEDIPSPHLIIAPKVVGDLTRVSVSHETLEGPVTVDWLVEGDQFTLDISLPFNSQAKVILPGEENHQLIQGGTYVFKHKLSKTDTQ